MDDRGTGGTGSTGNGHKKSSGPSRFPQKLCRVPGNSGTPGTSRRNSIVVTDSRKAILQVKRPVSARRGDRLRASPAPRRSLEEILLSLKISTRGAHKCWKDLANR